jgi:hypothetical protein
MRALPSPADDRARIRRWRVDLERWRDLLVELHADNLISLDEAAWLARADPSDLIVERLHATFNDAQLASLSRALLVRRARVEELLTLGVSGLNCDGEDLVSVPDEELGRRGRAALELEQRQRTSAWLDGYAALLAAETARRRGRA